MLAIPRHPVGKVAGTGLAVLSLLGALALPAAAQDSSSGSWAFVQVGTSGSTRQATIGIQVPMANSWRLGGGELTAYWDFLLSRWSYEAPTQQRHDLLAQVGAKPTFRWSPGGAFGRSFFEAGVGATFTSSLYRTEGKRFSTKFNFGDHLAVGYTLDPERTHEVALRVEHYSNAGIKHPNPGENFVQLRYARRF